MVANNIKKVFTINAVNCRIQEIKHFITDANTLFIASKHTSFVSISRFLSFLLEKLKVDLFFIFCANILRLSFREIRCAKIFFRRRCPNFVFLSQQTEMYNLLKFKLIYTNQNTFGKNFYFYYDLLIFSEYKGKKRKKI